MEQDNYDEDLVYYCTNCMSLKIKEVEVKLNYKIEYCGVCGDTNIEKTDIDTWEALYYNLYGEYFVERTKRLGKDKGGKDLIS